MEVQLCLQDGGRVHLESLSFGGGDEPARLGQVVHRVVATAQAQARLEGRRGGGEREVEDEDGMNKLLYSRHICIWYVCVHAY